MSFLKILSVSATNNSWGTLFRGNFVLDLMIITRWWRAKTAYTHALTHGRAMNKTPSIAS